MRSPSPRPRVGWRQSLGLALLALRAWSTRQVLVAVLAGLAVAALVGVATALIPNPVFGREIAPTAWSYPVWLVTSVMSGLLVATYVRPAGAEPPTHHAAEEPSGSRLGLAGGVLAWLAVGCPVCNKLALLALGYSGAIAWFTPVQPFLALAAVVLSSVALVSRLHGQVHCPVRPEPVSVP